MEDILAAILIIPFGLGLLCLLGFGDDDDEF
jgi:hypothetical protein